jgi:hypothetical protein
VITFSLHYYSARINLLEFGEDDERSRQNSSAHGLYNMAEISYALYRDIRLQGA